MLSMLRMLCVLRVLGMQRLLRDRQHLRRPAGQPQGLRLTCARQQRVPHPLMAGEKCMLRDWACRLGRLESAADRKLLLEHVCRQCLQSQRSVVTVGAVYQEVAACCMGSLQVVKVRGL